MKLIAFILQMYAGTASPNKRPTIFDVFRPRSKSDAKKKERELAKAISTEHSGSSSSTHSGSGIMHSMKAAMQHTMGTRSDGKTKSTKDGSAHPHGGSDAQVIFVSFFFSVFCTCCGRFWNCFLICFFFFFSQYYHTVTAVRRVDHAKSPMTKVMDLFRHRSNSAVSEADKRKAVSSLLQLKT